MLEQVQIVWCFHKWNTTAPFIGLLNLIKKNIVYEEYLKYLSNILVE